MSPDASSDPAPTRRGRLAQAGQAFVGFFDSVGKVVGAVAGILAVAAALGLVTLSGNESSGDKDADDEPNAAPPVRFAADDLASVTNERFAFSFRHPVAWEQQDAFNSDGGSVFRAPGETAELHAFGVNAYDGPTGVLERLDLSRREPEAVGAGRGGVVLSDDVRFVAWDGPTADKTPASRVVYQSRDQNSGRSVTSISVLTTQEGRDVTITCQVVRSRFEAYEGACNQLVASLKLQSLEVRVLTSRCAKDSRGCSSRS